MSYALIIIGAGPAGISMAAEAMASGIKPHDVLVIEKSNVHSWAIRKFYPEEKLVAANYKGQSARCTGVMCITDSSKPETLTYLDKCIEQNNIDVRYNESVTKIEKTIQGFLIETSHGSYHSDTCVIAIGMMGRPNRPLYSIPGTIKSRVTFDITSYPIRNCHVLVVGGGDSASEYAQYLYQEGNNVSLSYRNDQFRRMNDINKDSIESLSNQGHIELLLQSNIDSLSETFSKDGHQQVSVLFKEKEFGEKKFDHIVLALGGTTPKNFLMLLGIEFNGDQPIIKDGLETSVPGLFLIGDLSAGRRGGSIISAFNSSHEAMRKICTDYLQCSI